MRRVFVGSLLCDFVRCMAPKAAKPHPPLCAMSRSSRPVQLTLALPPADYRAYVAAARILARIMGRKAPDALALIHHNLVKRDPTGVADDYLDSIGWPLAAGRAISVRRPARKPVRHSHGPLLLASPRGLPSPLADPARN